MRAGAQVVRQRTYLARLGVIPPSFAPTRNPSPLSLGFPETASRCCLSCISTERVAVRKGEPIGSSVSEVFFFSACIEGATLLSGLVPGTGTTEISGGVSALPNKLFRSRVLGTRSVWIEDSTIFVAVIVTRIEPGCPVSMIVARYCSIAIFWQVESTCTLFVCGHARVSGTSTYSHEREYGFQVLA
jgi:hypothetical protein